MPAQPYNRTRQRWCAPSRPSSPSAPTTPQPSASDETPSATTHRPNGRAPDNHGEPRRRSHNAPHRPNCWISAAVSTLPRAARPVTGWALPVVGLVGTQFSQPYGERLSGCFAPGERGWLRISDAYEFRHRELLEHLAPTTSAD